jgi:hypothetical protein
VVIGPTRPRLATALVVLSVLLGSLGWGTATAHQGPDHGPNPAVAAPLLHAEQLAARGQDAGPRTLAERGRRPAPLPTSALFAALVGALVLAGLAAGIGAWREHSSAGLRGGPRRTWSRAPPHHLQPV